MCGFGLGLEFLKLLLAEPFSVCWWRRVGLGVLGCKGVDEPVYGSMIDMGLLQPNVSTADLLVALLFMPVCTSCLTC